MTDFSPYDLGATPFYATRFDPRCSFCLFVPSTYRHGTTTSMDVVVVVHGSDRPAQTWRDAWADFAEEHDCIVVAPLFPAGLVEPWELENYKLWQPELLRSDLVLVDILQLLTDHWQIELASLHLHGFSGGAQFAHRFFLLHPGLLDSVSIAAPGAVTLIDDDHGWWAGTGDIVAKFGRAVDVAAMRGVAVQLVVGADDTDDEEPHVPEDSPLWVAGANDAGATRVERIRSLGRNYADHGIRYRLDIVPQTAHDDGPLREVIRGFVAESLAHSRTEHTRA